MAQAIRVRPTIEVLSPAGERNRATVRRSPGLRSLAGTTAGLLDNHKSNTAEFLDLIARGLLADYGVRDVLRLTKLSAALPANAEALERLESCDFVVTAFAD